MKALWLEEIGGGLELRDVDPPQAARGSVVVEVLCVRVPANTADVLKGKPPYLLPVPFIPGPACIGRVLKVGDDVMDIEPGEVVLCNSLLSSGAPDGLSDDILIGWTGNGTERGKAMQTLWRHGSFAEQAIYPRACVTTLAGPNGFAREHLAALPSIAIADAGLQRGFLQAGQTVLILGATGQLGSCAVLAALARGAAKVIAVGRNKNRLGDLNALSPRVQVCSVESLAGLSVTTQTELVLDVSAHMESPAAIVSAVECLRPGGTAVLSGGRRGPIPLRYDWIMRNQITVRGSFMFDQVTASGTWGLVSGGQLDVRQIRSQSFGLAEMDKAVEKAGNLGGLDVAVLIP